MGNEYYSRFPCATCGVHFDRPTGRGRPRIYCDACKAAKEPKKMYLDGPSRVSKDCGWCGTAMVIPQRHEEKRSACSRSCASHLKAMARGHHSRAKHIVCAFCSKETTVAAYKNRDKVRFCSVQCVQSLNSKICSERDALYRIAARVAALAISAIKQEVQALRRIASAIKSQGICRHCHKLYVRKKPHQHHCSQECRLKSADAAVSRYRSSDTYKAMKRRGKSRRRAVLRGCISENIDPIKVFERDKWRCHLCGIKTPSRLRGSTDDRAPELEHIVSLADGGSHTWGNVACACRRCNGAKGAASKGQLGLGFAM